MIKQAEYELLKEYKKQGYEWLVRANDRSLYVFKTIPSKLSSYWTVDRGLPYPNRIYGYEDDLLNYVTWEDEEPTKIDDLIKDYEKYKPTIPQFVADWIEDRKPIYTLKGLFSSSNMPKIVKSWVTMDNDNCELMALAWIYGYEVEKEKEKLYTVELPNPNIIGNEVNVLMMNGFGQIVIKKEFGDEWKKENGFRLTEAEIKKDFEWVWQFAEEVE